MCVSGEDESELVVYWCECVCKGGVECVSEQNMVLHLKFLFFSCTASVVLAGYNG